jgi:hypothetical protein
MPRSITRRFGDDRPVSLRASTVCAASPIRSANAPVARPCGLVIAPYVTIARIHGEQYDVDS